MNYIKSFFCNSYSCGERILRTAVFQSGVSNDGLLEVFLIKIYKIFAQMTCCPRDYDSQRAERGLQTLRRLGANEKYIYPADGKAKIHMMTMSSSKLEAKIEHHGAKWKNLTILESGKERSILAIIPPQTPSKDWENFEKDLRHLKWNKQRVTTSDHAKLEVIVTCKNADKINEEDWHQKLFLYINPPDDYFVMSARRIGFYMGMKQNVCLYDERGKGKSKPGKASEGGYYNDGMAVYDEIKRDFDPKNIWIGGFCGGCQTAAYLKTKTHETGVNLILENFSSDIKRDFADRELCPARTFANLFWRGLLSRDIPEAYKPAENGLNVQGLLEKLKYSENGKILVISAKNDQRLPEEVAKRNVEMARKINKTAHVCFESEVKDPHSDVYFKYPEPASQAIDFIFGK